MRTRALLFSLTLVGCGMLGSPSAGDGELPNAQAGPFRLLRSGELDREVTSSVAPYLAKSDQQRYRSPFPLDIDGDPSTLASSLYATAGEEASSRIVRFSTGDGRSLSRIPEVVLEATLDWEGGFVASPSALRVGEETWLYYEAEGGVGLARSTDGESFVKESSAVLVDALGCGGASPSERPGKPSVIRLPDGSFRLFFALAGALCEARSSDGIGWSLTEGDGVILRAPADPEAFDTSLAHPFALLARTAEGRVVTRVYYTGTDGEGATAIGLAARFGTEGPLVRASSPVLKSDRGAREPAVLAFDDFSLLFVTQAAGSTEALAYPALAGAVAPANLGLDGR